MARAGHRRLGEEKGWRREEGQKQTGIQPFSKHSLGTYCAPGFERQRAGAELAPGHRAGRDALCHILTHPGPSTCGGGRRSL